jgi:hypothetical protein
VRALFALIVLSLLAAGSAGGEREPARDDPLAPLRHLTAEQQSFGVILDAKTGRALAAFRVNNPIRAAIPDGDGGWYIGGGFIRVKGELRKRLAHIDADGRLDPDWKPEANGNGVSVTALAKIGSRLYVAGDFARLEHEPRLHFGALDVRTGKLDPRWRPQPTRPLDQILLAAGNRIIAGGGSCCSEAGSAVSALDGRTGRTDPTWKPHVGPITLFGSGVYLLASNGRGVLVRGGLTRSCADVTIGEIDPRTARLSRKWSARADRQRSLWCQLMAAAIGKRRIFASVNGAATVVAFSRSSGDVDRRWEAPLTAVTAFYGTTSAYAVVVTGRRVFVTGDFDRLRGLHRNGFAAVDADTGRVLAAWQPHAAWPDGTLLAPSRDRLLLGISLSTELRFAFTGLKTYQPVKTLRLVLALTGPGSVRIALGRGCDVNSWLNTGRCSGLLIRRLSTVRFIRAARKRYVRRLGVAPGRYFIRFIPTTRRGEEQTPQDFPIRVP